MNDRRPSAIHEKRRRLRFESLDEVLADAENLAAGPVRQLGHWTLGQNLMHLATVYEKSIDGTDFRPGWLFRVLGTLIVPFWKRWVLRIGLPAGVRPPNFLFKEVAPPDQVSVEEGLQALRHAISRLKLESERDWEQSFHVFTRDEWDRFHMRHAELHLSFILPVERNPSHRLLERTFDMEPQHPIPQPPSELPWSRACLLAVGWIVGGIVATAILAGLLNGLDLVNGQDMVVTFWTGICVAIGVIVGSQAVHRSWRVGIVLPLLLIPAGLLVCFLAIVAIYGQWAR